MITNADITIYNRKANPETKKMEYCRTILRNVHWHTDQKVTVDKGLQSADMYKIRVPVRNREEPYLTPEEYAALPFGGHAGFWTTENGDLFVKGATDQDIDKPSDLEGRHLIVGKVQSHSDNRRGGQPHIRIGGA